MTIRGQKSRPMASLKMVNDPLSRAWLAMTAAHADITTPATTNQSGIIP